MYLKVIPGPGGQIHLRILRGTQAVIYRGGKVDLGETTKLFVISNGIFRENNPLKIFCYFSEGTIN